jgi:hypothetical protein
LSGEALAEEGTGGASFIPALDKADIEWAVAQIEAERKLARADFEKDMV